MALPRDSWDMTMADNKSLGRLQYQSQGEDVVILRTVLLTSIFFWSLTILYTVGSTRRKFKAVKTNGMKISFILG